MAPAESVPTMELFMASPEGAALLFSYIYLSILYKFVHLRVVYHTILLLVLNTMTVVDEEAAHSKSTHNTLRFKLDNFIDCKKQERLEKQPEISNTNES